MKYLFIYVVFLFVPSSPAENHTPQKTSRHSAEAPPIAGETVVYLTPKDTSGYFRVLSQSGTDERSKKIALYLAKEIPNRLQVLETLGAQYGGWKERNLSKRLFPFDIHIMSGKPIGQSHFSMPETDPKIEGPTVWLGSDFPDKAWPSVAELVLHEFTHIMLRKYEFNFPGKPSLLQQFHPTEEALCDCLSTYLTGTRPYIGGGLGKLFQQQTQQMISVSTSPIQKFALASQLETHSERAIRDFGTGFPLQKAYSFPNEYIISTSLNTGFSEVASVLGHRKVVTAVLDTLNKRPHVLKDGDFYLTLQELTKTATSNEKQSLLKRLSVLGWHPPKNVSASLTSSVLKSDEGFELELTPSNELSQQMNELNGVALGIVNLETKNKVKLGLIASFGAIASPQIKLVPRQQSLCKPDSCVCAAELPLSATLNFLSKKGAISKTKRQTVTLPPLKENTCYELEIVGKL